MTNHQNRAARYTVLDREGYVKINGATLARAADAVLTHDGYEFEIRPSDDGFELWTSAFSRNSTAWNGLGRSVIFSLHKDEALAHAEIYRQVIRNADWWLGQSVMTDDEYADYVAETTAYDDE